MIFFYYSRNTGDFQCRTWGQISKIKKRRIPAGILPVCLSAVDLEGNEKTFQITTNKSTVGEALMDEGLLAGEPGPYGLYVKTVNGITLDYDKDGKYWAFYVDGEYGLTGVDETAIQPGSTYCFKPE